MSLIKKENGISVFRPAPKMEQVENDKASTSEVVKKKENPAACIFVASLNKNIDDEELSSSVFNHFKQWGKLLGVKVLKDWLKRPYAFVQFELEEDGKKALQEAPGTIIHGRSIRCEPARVNRSICLISFNQPFNKQFLKTHLSTFGEIEDVSILQPNGKFHYVFVKFKYRDDAIKAYLALKCTDLNNANHWFVEWASNLDINNMYGGGVCGNIISRSLDRFSIFIGNLSQSTTEMELRDRFRSYGKILNLHTIRKPVHYRHKRVFAFIKYQNEREAANAIDHENGQLWDEKVIRVCYREYYHNYCAYNTNNNCNSNNTSAAAVLPSSCWYYYYHNNNNNNNKQGYSSMMEQSSYKSNNKKQQIMPPSTPPPDNNNYIFMPYCNPAAATAATTTIYDPNSYSYMATSGIIPSSPEKSSLFNNNMMIPAAATNNATAASNTAGAFYTINSKEDNNNLYNQTSSCSYYPYSSTAATAMVYYPYPATPTTTGNNQPYYYAGIQRQQRRTNKEDDGVTNA